MGKYTKQRLISLLSISSIVGLAVGIYIGVIQSLLLGLIVGISLAGITALIIDMFYSYEQKEIVEEKKAVIKNVSKKKSRLTIRQLFLIVVLGFGLARFLPILVGIFYKPQGLLANAIVYGIGFTLGISLAELIGKHWSWAKGK